jgi:hypothetical protein
MADRAKELRIELAGLLARHEPTLSEDDRAQLVRLEEGYGWRPGRRPAPDNESEDEDGAIEGSDDPRKA